jgi:hypothetical protein
MTLGSLLLFLALLIIVSLVVARPLIEGGLDEAPAEDRKSHWLAERERILDALAELDADWQLGKIPKEIYYSQRQQLITKGAEAIEEIEKEERVGKRRTGKATQSADELENMIAAYRRKVRK